MDTTTLVVLLRTGNILLSQQDLNAISFAALEGGATHIDTSVLGIGERNGITPLGGFVARMYAADPAAIQKKYDLLKLKELHQPGPSRGKMHIPLDRHFTGK